MVELEIKRLTTAESWMSSGSSAYPGDNAASPMLGQHHAGGGGLTDGCYALYGPGSNVAQVENVLAQIKVGDGGRGASICPRIVRRRAVYCGNLRLTTPFPSLRPPIPKRPQSACCSSLTRTRQQPPSSQPLQWWRHTPTPAMSRPPSPPSCGDWSLMRAAAAVCRRHTERLHPSGKPACSFL